MLGSIGESMWKSTSLSSFSVQTMKRGWRSDGKMTHTTSVEYHHLAVFPLMYFLFSQTMRFGRIERRSTVSHRRRRTSCGFWCDKHHQGKERNHHPVCRAEWVQGNAVHRAIASLGCPDPSLIGSSIWSSLGFLCWVGVWRPRCHTGEHSSECHLSSFSWEHTFSR